MARDFSNLRYEIDHIEENHSGTFSHEYQYVDFGQLVDEKGWEDALDHAVNSAKIMVKNLYYVASEGAGLDVVPF